MTRSYSYDDESYGGQSRRLPYHMGQDRYMNSTYYEGGRSSRRRNGLPPYENPQSDLDLDDPKNRKRIPVACGRCRKRKIRCSGPQHDSSCTNCKNSGNTDCQFNRVQSVEAHYREDAFMDKISYDRTTDFSYNPDLARVVQCRGSSQLNIYTTQAPGYTPMPGLHYAMYRQSPPEYQSQTKSNGYTPAYGGVYGENNAFDYGINTSMQPPYYGHDHMDLTPTNGSSRDWIPMNHYAKNSATGILNGSEAVLYGTPQLQYTTAINTLRGNFSTESNNLSLGGMASSLPTPSPQISSERLLPIPSTVRSNVVTSPLIRSTESIPYGNNVTKGHFSQSTSVNYLPFMSSSSSIDSYSTGTLSNSLDSPHEAYASTSSWLSQPEVVAPSLLTQSHESTEELDYKAPTGRTRKATHEGKKFNVTLPHLDRELWATTTMMPESNVRGQDRAAAFRIDNSGFRKASQNGQNYVECMSGMDRNTYSSPDHQEHAQLSKESAQTGRQASVDMCRSATHHSSRSSLRSRKSTSHN